MTTKKTVEKKEPAEEITYSKAQLLASSRFANRRDLLDALLTDGKEYSLAQVAEITEKYLKGGVE